MKRLVLTAAALVVLSVGVQAQPASPPPAPPQSAPPQSVCLQVGQVYDFQPVPGNRSLIVTDRFRKKYKVSFNGICPDLQFNMGLGFKSFGTSQLSCLTRGDYVIAHDPAVPLNRCPIQKIESYTPQMEQADALAAQAAKTR